MIYLTLNLLNFSFYFPSADLIVTQYEIHKPAKNITNKGGDGCQKMKWVAGSDNWEKEHLRMNKNEIEFRKLTA